MGKQHRNKRFNKNKNRPNRNNNGNRKPFNNKRKPHGGDGGFVKKDNSKKFVKISLKEDQVGITEYLSNGEGFMGVLKSRFSDFHVNEIDLNGKVLQLNDLQIPQNIENVLSAEELEAARESVKDVFSEESWADINKYAELKSQNNIQPEDSNIYVDVTSFDKAKRTQVHKIIKKLYDGKLVSCTVDGEKIGKAENTKFICIQKPKGRDRNKWTFPQEYVHFLVHKENLDTGEVAAAMANKLNLRPSQVNYCGTKDKRAKTTQKFCIKKRVPSQIVSSIRNISGVKVGNFDFNKEVLKLGQLKGNRFRIAIRNLMGDREKIESSLKNIKENGFINYFGLQRFGNCSAVPTYEVGVALLSSDYKLACELILKPRDNDIPFLKAIREKWWKDRNSAEAASMFHSDRFIEKKLLDGLAQFGEHDYSAALSKIPRNILLLYPHAFQSLIFNKIASRRIKEFGLKVIPGDLVYRNKEELDDFIEADEESNEIQTEAVEESIDDKNSESDEACNVTEEPTESAFKLKVKTLTEQDIKSGDYTILDVVLPLPGFDITYPGNEVANWYEEMLATYNLSSEKLKHNVKAFAMPGAYRKLILKPTEMSWEFRSYATPEQNLILSDFELFKGKTLEQTAEKDNKYEALILDFCLSTSAYATMMIRELLKSDTSPAFQKSLQEAATKQEIKKEVKDLEEAKENEEVKASNGADENLVAADDTIEADEKKSTNLKRMAETDEEAATANKISKTED